MIRRVRIQGYKSLKDVEIHFQPLTLFVGPNSAGKSNLFDALNLLSRMVTAENLNTAFEDHRGAPLEAFYFGDKGIADLLEQETAQFTFEVDVELSPKAVEEVNRQTYQINPSHPSIDKYLRYILTVEIKTKSGGLRVLREEMFILNPRN